LQADVNHQPNENQDDIKQYQEQVIIVKVRDEVSDSDGQVHDRQTFINAMPNARMMPMGAKVLRLL
jgi:hypothetical protein